MPEISDEQLAELKQKAETAESALEQAKALESSKERILKESNDYKTRAQKAEEAVDLAKKEQLEADGKLSELLNMEREKVRSLEDRLNETSSSVLKEKMRAEVAKFAKDAHDVDAILRVPKHRDALKVDETSLSIEGVEEFVKKVRETDAYLFKKKSMDPGDNTPPAKGDDTVLNDDEKYRAELRACNSTKELEAVKKKWGKDLSY